MYWLDHFTGIGRLIPVSAIQKQDHGFETLSCQMRIVKSIKEQLK